MRQIAAYSGPNLPLNPAQTCHPYNFILKNVRENKVVNFQTE